MLKSTGAGNLRDLIGMRVEVVGIGGRVLRLKALRLSLIYST